MSKVEIFCPRSNSWMECYVDGFDPATRCYHVTFDYDWKSPRWVRPDQLRFCPPPPPSTWIPLLRERVECEAKMDDSTPWSWFEGIVYGRSRSKTGFLVKFLGTNQKEMISIESLRPPPEKKSFPVSSIHLVFVRLPYTVPEEHLERFLERLHEIKRATRLIHVEMSAPNELKMIGAVLCMRAASLAIANIAIDDEKNDHNVSSNPSDKPYKSKHSNTMEEESYSDLDEVTIRMDTVEEDGTDEDPLDGDEDADAGDGDDEEHHSPQQPEMGSRWVEMFDKMIRTTYSDVVETKSGLTVVSHSDEAVDVLLADFERAVEDPFVRKWICANDTLNELVEYVDSRNSRKTEVVGLDTFARNVEVLWTVYLVSLQRQGERR